MITIKLLDARRGLNLKCRELFADEKIAEAIYRYLCEGIEECEDAEPVRMKGRWIYGESEEGHDGYFCSQCGNFVPWIYKEFDISFIKEFKFCPNCGAKMLDS